MEQKRVALNNDRWLSGWKGLANYLDCSERTCKNLVKDGLPMVKRESGTPMFKTIDIDVWLKKNKKL